MRRAVHFIVFLVALVALGFVWHVYGGRAGIGTAADRPAGVHGSLGAPGGAIIAEEAQRVSATEEAHEAMEEMRRRYPVPKSELEPRVYATATDNYMELAARFVVPVRQARPTTTTELTRRVKARLDEVGIPISSSTTDVTLFSGDDRTSRGSSRSG
ncbi:MAG TPA: hypothetical protein VFL60_06585 [Gaiellaceae bacterium]|nr:hypothetical protein [Gaiellaceae bacterium]